MHKPCNFKNTFLVLKHVALFKNGDFSNKDLKERSRPSISSITSVDVRLWTQQREGCFALSERNSTSPLVTSPIRRDCLVATR